MRLTDILDLELVLPDLQGENKREVLNEFAALLDSREKIRDQNGFLEVILAREALGSTGIGEGIAIPHGKLKNMDRLVLACGISHKGVDFDAMDGKPVHIFFVLIAPEDSPGDHLKALARISRVLKNREFRDRLLEAGSAKELYQLICEEDEKYGS
ncbi:MAG: PTS sugar transporter subunit IIA [Deltaproteobacteria bacterium]|nr:PTS sugar transporter subunit IIA [Deltaproteobacteria bacterium]